VSNVINGEELLPDRASLTLCHIEKERDSWTVEAMAPNSASCPDCGILSLAGSQQELCATDLLPRLDPVTGKQAMETKRCEELVRRLCFGRTTWRAADEALGTALQQEYIAAPDQALG